jgi:predicted GIY-YIG superfamily endonuclease
MGHDYFVYILTDKSRATLYIGITNDLLNRIWQHRNPEARFLHAALSLHHPRLV